MTREQLEATAADDIEQDVVEYLRSHPEFFARYPEILEALEVPHSCGNAVSLVEYQVSVLRDQTRDLRAKLKKLVANARENEELNQRLHRLTLSLLESNSIDEVFANIYSSLRDDFSAEHASIRLFAEPAEATDRGLAEFVGKETAAVDLFESLFTSMKPVCGRMKPEQIEFLFPGHGGDIQSCAVLPLGESACVGLLAVGSSDAQRYFAGMGVVFLGQLSETVTRIVRPYLLRS
ncbi:MAG: DUF484 family protein [Gammaproteobacteria bacterium]|nr:DUF484 family protein [Gammaproteobacteria bacterium]